MVFESIGYDTAPIVDCENINNWLVLFKQYLSPHHGQTKVLEMRVPVNESEPERQTRLNIYGPINQRICRKLESACRGNESLQLILKKSKRYTDWASEILENFIEEISKRRKIELECILTEFFKLKAFPRESPENFILRLETILERIICLDHREIPKDSFIQYQALEGIRNYHPELVESIERLELSTKEIFSIIAGRGNEIINDRLFENLINIHQINNQREKELLDNIGISPRNKKVSCKATIEAVLKTEKLFESQSQIEKNISIVKSPELSTISVSKLHKPKTIMKYCYLCNSPNHFAKGCRLRKRFSRFEAFEAETKRKLTNKAEARLDKCVQDSLHERSNKKVRGTYNNLEINEITRCVYEVLMSTHEGCSGLINIDSGANRLILRLCSWFDEINKNAKSNLSTADESGGLSVDGVGTFGSFNNVKWCKKVSVDLVSVAKLGEIGFYSVLGMSKEEPVQIRCKRTHLVVKRGVMINDLYWLTIQDFFDLAYRGGLTIDEHKTKCQKSSEAHCNITAETKGRSSEDIPDSELSQWMEESAALAIMSKESTNFKVDLSENLLEVCNLASSRRVNMLRLLHDRTGHGNENMLISAHKEKLITGMKFSDKELRKYALKDIPLCDICARAKITRVSFNKLHKIRGKNIGDYISCDIAVFKNCESRKGYRYVLAFADHATKCWVYPMKQRNEFPKHFEDLVNVKLRARRVSIKHYHADGGAELIGKSILDSLKKMGATYSWNPADTPELNATSERKFRTLSERCLSMLLQSGLPVDFWWDCYETSNFITNRLPTKTAKGYITPFEGVYEQPPDISNFRVWGCKTYLRVPRNHHRKDWRDKVYSGHLVGYGESGEMGWQIFVPELNDTIAGVNCIFNEIIPDYTEEYFNTVRAMQIEVVTNEEDIENFRHLSGTRYRDDETRHEYINTRITLYDGLIVAYRAPVRSNGEAGNEEKSPIHIADVIRMMGGKENQDNTALEYWREHWGKLWMMEESITER